VFVQLEVKDPAFKSQTKDDFRSPTKEWGFDAISIVRTDEDKSTLFANKLVRPSGLIAKTVTREVLARDKAKLRRAGNTSRAQHVQVDGLKDAVLAGKAGGGATLIIVEGLSAGTAVLSSHSREKFGLLALTGKVLNVRGMPLDKALENKVIKSLIQTLGITPDMKDPKQLRYEKVILVTDQDEDGTHIKSLLLNFFSHFYKDMVRNRGFVSDFPTPLIRVNPKNGSAPCTFFTHLEFQRWCKTQDMEERLRPPLSICQRTRAR
jgi:DNA topoisomerase-2